MAAPPGDESQNTLRERMTAQKSAKDEDANKPGSVSQASDIEAKDKKREVVYGRTPDGTVFPIPQTHNVLAGLFDPRLPKSTLDIVTLSLLSLQVILWLFLPLSISRYLFMGVFAAFRLMYNAGLGYVLTQQSKKRWIVNTVKRRGLLDENKHPQIKAWIERQVTVKMGKTYKFDAMPAEWNVWVLFRHMVDIILLNDFLAYFLCGVSFMRQPHLDDSAATLWYSLRWVSGISLILFNLWVKTDAHRIITDLAWYWADTFFSSSQNLVFDGVFEMAPHPMYSVGYLGFYGLCLIVGSETLLYVSLAAHACQFAFLVFFENPHIERTYGERKPLAMRVPMQTGTPRQEARSPAGHVASTTEAPRPAKTRQDSTSSSASTPDSLADTPIGTDESDYETDTDTATHAYRGATRRDSDSFSEDLDAEEGDSTMLATSSRMAFLEQQPRKPHLRSKHDFDAYYFRHDLLMVQNFDPLRATDIALALAIFYLLAAFLLPNLSSRGQLVAIFGNALAWRFVHTFVLGSVLKAQSERKWMVRHFLKHYHYEGTGFGAVEEAFNNWKGVYNISLCLVYASFGLLALRCYDWSFAHQTLRHTLGLLLIALHAWSAKAIFDVLGRFGWFYGDFFISGEGTSPQLLYTGIYRHVNNPERIMGGAAFFGLALISGSKLVGLLAVVSVLSHFWFLSCVENPHMKRLYGSGLRKEAGVTKTFRNAASKNSHRAPPQVKRAVQEIQGTLERVYDDTQLAVEEFLRRSAPRLTDYVENTKVLLREQGEKLLISRVGNVTLLDNTANVDVFTLSHAVEDLRHQTAFEREVLPLAMQAILQEGDLLFMPPKWWHSLKSLERSFSVSMWF